MQINDVLTHYGFHPIGNTPTDSPVIEWAHPSAKNAKEGACVVLQFGNRAVVHCSQGNPIYSVSAHDVEHLLRREFECFSSKQPILLAA